MYRDDLVHEFNDDMWLMYHDGTIDNDDDFFDQMNQWIDNKVIYTYECQKICYELEYDVFQEHEIFGKANNLPQAAYCAIYDLLGEHEDALTYNEMKTQNENA